MSDLPDFCRDCGRLVVATLPKTCEIRRGGTRINASMAQLPPKAVLVPSMLVGTALMLGACSSMTTYGTGTTAAAQTLQDVTGILSLGGKKKNEAQIDYEPRPPIVEPPASTLPPPGSDPSADVAANWPVDPDEEQKRIDALIKERQDAGQSLKFTVPDSPSGDPNYKAPISSHESVSPRTILRDKMRGSGPNSEETKKLFADAKNAKSGSFDENGNPVRRYLIEPPTAYREPDPESPVEITQKPKKEKKGFRLPDLWPF